MATITELKCALRETLESRGVLGQLKARIRAEVFSALDDQREPRPPLSHENLIINELIREYLEFNKYRYTASVLTAGFSHKNICRVYRQGKKKKRVQKSKKRKYSVSGSFLSENVLLMPEVREERPDCFELRRTVTQMTICYIQAAV
ncbi:heterogeneous nuclear ribonucleoprotein F/H [Sarotherodon galilaeus]